MGGMEPNLERFETFFRSLDLRPRHSTNAVDLGAGTGFQSIPLAKLGYNVTAIDQSQSLLQAMLDAADALPIKAVCDDIMRFTQYCPQPVELVVCMGDTLPHLTSRGDVAKLLEAVTTRLEPDGCCILMFRDLNEPRMGLDRFINVRSDLERIFTCFLEYGPERVQVHDLIHERQDNTWVLHKGSYSKLRLDPQWVSKLLVKGGLRINKTLQDAGMVTIVAKKSPS